MRIADCEVGACLYLVEDGVKGGFVIGQFIGIFPEVV